MNVKLTIKDRVKEFRRVRAGDIERHPLNYRTHPGPQREAMDDILQEVGIAGALVCYEKEDGTLRLIDGELRKDTDEDIEWPVLILDVDEAEANLLLATYDPLSAMATADPEVLGKLLHQVETGSEAIQSMLADLAEEAAVDWGTADEEELEDVKPQVDRAAELQEEWGTESGQLWIIEGKQTHRLLCGDSTKAEDVERLMNGEKAALCFTSPPYSDQRTYDGTANLSPEYLAQFIAAAKDECKVFAVNLGIARKGGQVDCYWNTYIEAADSVGLGLLSWNIWHLTGGYSVGQLTAMFPIEHEWIFVFGKSPIDLIPTVPNNAAGKTKSATDRSANGDMSNVKRVPIRACRELGTVVDAVPVQNNADHPAQYPIELAEAYIKSFRGGVYDPFLGSGTTMLAAEQLNRRCYGMEISPAYCAVILQRMKDAGCRCELAEEAPA